MILNRYEALQIVVGIVVIALAYLIFLWKPNINFENIGNATSNVSGLRIPMNLEDTVLTVINGITAVTSIIIGLSGAIIGLVYKVEFKNKKERGTLLRYALYSVFPLTILVFVFVCLTIGAVVIAVQLAITALILALGDFILSMLSILEKNDSQTKQTLKAGLT